MRKRSIPITQRNAREEGTGTYDIFRIGNQGNIRTLRVLVPKQVGNDVCVRYSRHGCEPVVLGFTSVDLVTVLYDVFVSVSRYIPRVNYRTK